MFCTPCVNPTTPFTHLTRGRSDVELRGIAGEPIVLFRAERGSDGGAYTVHRNGVLVVKRPNPSL